MEMLKRYFELQDQIYAYFGYDEPWGGHNFPLEDQTNCQWILDNKVLLWSDSVLTEEVVVEGEFIYATKIGGRRALIQQRVYYGVDYTAVVGDDVLMVFANARRCTDDNLLRVYHECWE